MGIGWAELLLVSVLLFFMLLVVTAAVVLIAFLIRLSRKPVSVARPDESKEHSRP